MSRPDLLTPEQLRAVLERVASALDLACNVCRSEALRHGDHESALSFHVLDHMLTGAGALADMAAGSGVVGNVYDWMCGPLFYDTPAPRP